MRALLAVVVLCAACSGGDPTGDGVRELAFDIRHYPTGGGGPGPAPRGTVAADVDGDGDMDVVICESKGRGPRLLRNRGDGAFDEGVRIADIEAFSSLDTTDFNGDGHADLLGATLSSVVVLLGAGDGSFRTSQTLPSLTGAQMQAYALDANQDEAVDVIVLWHGGVRAFIGRGDGTFTDGPFSLLGRAPAALTAAKFDTDAIPDLALVDAGRFQVAALRGVGDGAFVELGSVGVGRVPEAIAAGDFNEDGLNDFAVADSFSFEVSVLLLEESGALRRDAGYTVNGPASVAIADFNDDGHDDIVASALLEDRLIILAGDGTGAFAEAAAYVVPNAPQSPVVADFDGDGRADIAVGGDSMELSVLLNRTR